jgi:hypothetical protein
MIGQTPLATDDETAAVSEPVPADGSPATGVEHTSTVPADRPREIGGRDGPDPTRYGDWEKNGRCIDF